MSITAYSHLECCIHCEGVKLSKSLEESKLYDASVWNGSEWLHVKHGNKRCPQCRTYYKLNYAAGHFEKLNTLTTCDDKQIVLMNNHTGFTMKYLRKYWHRVCRSRTWAIAEAYNILGSQSQVEYGQIQKKT